jgi:hypothetical protein
MKFFIELFSQFRSGVFFADRDCPLRVCFGSWQTVDAAMVSDGTEDPLFIFFKVSELGDLIGKLGGFICGGARDGGERS